MGRDEQTVALLNSVNRERELTSEEIGRAERAARRAREREGRLYFRWLPKHTLAIRRALLRHGRCVVPMLAKQFGISERAVWRRMTLLRKAGEIPYISPPNGTGRYPRKGSKAGESECRV